MQALLPIEKKSSIKLEQKMAAPSYEEQYTYLDSIPFLYLTILSILKIISLIGIYLFIFKTKLYILSPYVLLLTIYWGIYIYYGIIGQPFFIGTHERQVKEFAKVNEWPSVDVFIPTCGENYKVVLNTITHVLNLDYSGILKIWVLDDGDNELIKNNLPNDNRLTYVVRPNRPEGKKGGNLCYTFKKSIGEFILIIDADFVVTSNFLLETIPYFKENKLGILQTPQYFRVEDQSSLVGKGAAFSQEVFYRFVQVARDRVNSAGCVGTNVIYRRKALEPWGGTAIVQASEDRYTAWRLQNDGWKIKYIPLALAAGACPTSINSLYTQAFRWANGSSRQLFSKDYWYNCPLFKQSKLTFLNWLTFGLSSLTFSVESISILLGFVPLVYLYSLYPEIVNWRNSLIFIPSILWLRLVNPFIAKSTWTVGVPMSGTISGYAYFMSILNVITNSEFKWVATGNVKETSKSTLVKRFRFIYPFWTTLQFSLVIGFAMKAILAGYPFYNYLTGIILACLSFATMLSIFILEKQGKLV